jgi:hypothetical protein
MRRTIKITETELRNIISESVRKFINEDMSSKHSAHTFNKYLDDNDFLMLSDRLYNDFVKRQVSIDDFIEEDFRDRLIEYAKDMVVEFVNEEAVNNFGYKYGELNDRGYYKVAEDLIDYVENKFKE